MDRWAILILIWGCGVWAAAPFRVGLVLDKGGRDDKSFNSSAYQGLQEAAKTLPIKTKVVESSDDASLEPNLRTFARRGFDLVIGIGFIQQEPLQRVARDFPKTKFLLIDAVAEGPNIRSVTFAEHEGSFLVGAIAALFSETKHIGFVGGMDIPMIRRFQMGYEAGARYVVPSSKVETSYIGSTGEAWRNPTKAKELTLAQFRKKADVVFTAAGASGLGVFDAAEEKQKFAIGVDSNQNWIKPGRILTSMLKRIDLAVLRTVELAVKNKFQPGAVVFGLADGGIDFSLDEHNRKLLTPEIEKKALEIKKGIASGKIKVPDFYMQHHL